MLDTNPIPEPEADVDTTAAQLTSAEAIIKDLVDVYGGERKAIEKAGKANEEANKARENSLEALADKLHGINEDLDKDAIQSIATSVVDRVFKHSDASTQRTRKSEIKTLLESRSHIKPMYDAFKAYRDRVQKDDPKYSPNLRTQVLGGLRKLRKNENLTPKAVIQELHAKRTAEVSSQELARKLLDKLLDSPAIKGVTEAGREYMDRRAIAAIEVLRGVIDDGVADIADDDMVAVNDKLTLQEIREHALADASEEQSSEALEEIVPEPEMAGDDEVGEGEDNTSSGPDLSGLDLTDLDELIGGA